MSDDDNSTDENQKTSSVIHFPQSKTKPKTSQSPPRELGLSELAKKYKGDTSSLKGHWCSRCKGIWYGFGGECECPVCGNRNG